MKNGTKYSWPHLLLVALLTIAVAESYVFAEHRDWQREEVAWRLTDGERIKAISYPQGKHPPTLDRRPQQKPEKKLILPQAAQRLAATTETITGPVFANVINSPPIDGFVPWIAVTVTDKRGDEFDFEAVPQYSIVGNYLTNRPDVNYAIGIYDTGASVHVMGNAAATHAGLFSTGHITSNSITISGVTGSVEAWVSQPIGIFIDGLGAIEPNGLLIDRSGMMGQSNVAIAVGQGSSLVDLPTVIGSPLSVYFTAVFYNDTQITRTRDGNNYNAPDIRIYEQDDPTIPAYANLIPLELRPLGATSVQYIPDYTDIFNPVPASPSLIIGNFSQSIFFVSSVDLYNGSHSAIDKTRFMFDTGAQISVIGSRIAARLALNPNNPDFEVEIQGVTGDTIIAPGFYVDAIDIPALGEWLSFTNVPVVLLDISSPEGGTVDGIIGMNLFADLNFVLRGGGLFLQDDPSVEYEPINRLAGDISPAGGDGSVNWLDLAAFANAWLANPLSPNWYSPADMVSDAIINFRDFAILAQNWQQSTP